MEEEAVVETPEAAEVAQPEQTEHEAPETEAKTETDEVVVTIGDAPAPEDEAPAPTWVKELRERHKETSRRNRELEAELAALKGANKPVEQLGAKPTLEGCDYDTEKFEAELASWHERRIAVEAEKRKAEEQRQAEERAWAARKQTYAERKQALKVSDYDDAEQAFTEVANTVQQGIVLKVAENPAVLVYALGKNPAKAKELTAIKDPVEFTAALVKLEAQLKVTPRKAPPLPEKRHAGSAPGSGVDQTLDRLRAEAERTGDLSKVLAYKKQMRGK